MYAGVRRTIGQILIWCMHRSGGLPTEYCVGGGVGLGGYRSNVVWVFSYRRIRIKYYVIGVVRLGGYP
jgi:hypothetical protein